MFTITQKNLSNSSTVALHIQLEGNIVRQTVQQMERKGDYCILSKLLFARGQVARGCIAFYYEELHHTWNMAMYTCNQLFYWHKFLVLQTRDIIKAWQPCKSNGNRMDKQRKHMVINQCCSLQTAVVGASKLPER